MRAKALPRPADGARSNQALAAISGAGIAYVSERSAAEDLASGRLMRMLPEWTPPFPGVCLYYPRQRLPSAGLTAFIDHFQAARRR